MLKKDYAKIKLIVFDLDDTLLDSNQSISSRTYRAIKQVVTKGIKVMLATGRMYSTVIPFAGNLGLDMPIISYNGAMINTYPLGERLYHNPIEEEVAKQVMQLCRERQWYIQTYIDDVLYVKELDKNAKLYARIIGAVPNPVGDQLYTIKGTPTKMLAIAEPGEIEQLKMEFHTRFGDILCIAESKPNYLEINNYTVNKGNALKFIASKLDIDRQEIMAFGNGINDIEMLRYSEWGVAVANSSPDVKKIARIVTGSNDEEGVADILEQYVIS